MLCPSCKGFEEKNSGKIEPLIYKLCIPTYWGWCLAFYWCLPTCTKWQESLWTSYISLYTNFGMDVGTKFAHISIFWQVTLCWMWYVSLFPYLLLSFHWWIFQNCGTTYLERCQCLHKQGFVDSQSLLTLYGLSMMWNTMMLVWFVTIDN